MLAILLVACDSKESTENWGLVASSNGLVYRINKTTGGVSLIAGEQGTELVELNERNRDDAKKNYLKDWPVQIIEPLGDITVSLKTTWRDGKLHYQLSAYPYRSALKKAREEKSILADAAFVIVLFDRDGFELESIPVRISAMSGIVDDSGKISAMRATGSRVCSVDTYDALGSAAVQWAGFPDSWP